MLKKHNVSLHLTLKPSMRLKWLLGLVHLLALFACLSSFLPVISQFALTLMLAVHFRVTSARSKNNRHTINYSRASGWRIAKNDGVVAVEILPTTVITTYAVFLHVEIKGTDAHISSVAPFLRRKKRQSILIAADMLSDDDYRRLVVTLKTAAIKSGRLSVSVGKI
ncbi:protein YgfX [Methylovulum sp.]|uniref:protein YgfX n=1 Tax=Methylovulum sp. TaxID=1916980 RepID=UPI00261647C6|nr:protein YgfX [Methylovulum sp.]MDD5126321.1 hypothetical protein [Methylovulum sp.]